ncbi:mycothione reductase [Actinokineospora sp.]|uniref:mycothione reductase n=1 Tax=Actinokineospora sp. TaxID=1872133 RepID=UPI0040384761
MRHFDLVIIGTGSGNSLLDARFADWDVALVERGVFGGTCLNVGCIPTKMFVHTADLASVPAAAARLGVDETLDAVHWPRVRDRIFGRIDPIADGGRQYRTEHPDNANVTVYAGDARFTGERRLEIIPNDGSAPETITADRVVLAAGGRPVVPPIEGIDAVEFHTSDTVMRLDALPRGMVILGGGFIAAEFAHVFSAYGVDVTVVARSGALLRHEDRDISLRFTESARERWDVRLDRKTVRAERAGAGVRLHLEGPDGAETVEADVLLVATGRTPNADQLDVAAGGIALAPDGFVQVDEFQRTTADGVWALGDISSPWELKHVANHEAKIVKHNLLHPDAPRAADHRFVPHAVFTSPQIAAVGLTEQEAERRGVRYVASTQAYSGIAYGWAMEDTTGFVKLLADPATGLLLGAHIIGPQASTVIQPVIQAMSFGLDARSMATGQYWIHPAMPELLENALLNLPLA